MKTSKQLTEEIFEKITVRERERYHAKKRAKRIFAACMILGFLVPSAVHFATTEELNHQQEFTFSPYEEIPFDPDLPCEDSTETYDKNDFSISLMV